MTRTASPSAGPAPARPRSCSTRAHGAARRARRCRPGPPHGEPTMPLDDFLHGRLALTDKPADEYLPWRGHVTDHIVLLADGTHVSVLRLDGKPLSLLDEPARYAERRRRHAVLRSLADTNVA